VLINSWKARPALPGGIASRIIDHYLGEESRDYSTEARELYATEEKRRADFERELLASRLPGTTPSVPLAAYAGSYRDRLGLEARVWLEADTLRLQYGGGESAMLSHWHHDLFRARWSNPLHAELMSTFVSFGLDAEGKIDRLHMEPNGDEVDARRVTP